MRSQIMTFLAGLALSAAQTGVSAAAATPSKDEVTPSRLRWGSATLYSENDKYFAGTDRNYTNGFKFSVLSTDVHSFTEDPVPAPVQQIARAFGRLLPTGYDYKLGLSFGQNIYTPADIATTAPQPLDRPYAGWLYGSTAFQVYRPPLESESAWGANGRLDTFEFTVGMVGPGALGRQVQNNFHDLIDVEHANGWQHQIHNEPGLVLAYERKYRVATPDARSGWGADLISRMGVSVGNIFTFANLGLEARVGWQLPADFGTNLIRPSGDSNSRQRAAWSGFGFVATEARAVVRDVTLQGNTFEDSAHISAKRFVGDLLGGFAIGTRHWQFTYAQALRTREFKGQTRQSVFGSLSVTFYY